MKVLFLVFFLFFSWSIFGNTSYILFEKLPVNKENDTHIRFIKENSTYFGPKSSPWVFSVNKTSLISGLKEAFAFFSVQDGTNLENTLLLGDVSSFLYNLNELTFLETAEKYYKKAIQLAPLDFRPYWFLGAFYAAANDPIHSIEFFRMAKIRLPKTEPVLFWEEFAAAANQAGMPTTCLYAMDKARSILGRPSEYEKTFGQSVRNTIYEVNSNRSYANKDLWSYTEQDVITFISRPLGVKINIDPEWELNISDFDKKTLLFSIAPPPVSNEDGQDRTYTMSITCKVTTEDDDLKAFVNSLVASNAEKTEIEFSAKYPNMVSYELIDPETNTDKGGSHKLLLGIKRKQPLYPGLELEQPQSDPSNKSNAKGRFAGTIYYGIMLETSEDIFQVAKRTFWDLFVNQMLLE